MQFRNRLRPGGFIRAHINVWFETLEIDTVESEATGKVNGGTKKKKKKKKTVRLSK